MPDTNLTVYGRTEDARLLRFADLTHRANLIEIDFDAETGVLLADTLQIVRRLVEASLQQRREITRLRRRVAELESTSSPVPPFSIEKRSRAWAVLDQRGELVCLALYKKGAFEVVRRLSERSGLRRTSQAPTVAPLSQADSQENCRLS
ncbi:MAG: hypothetical protein H0U67_14370 [Gemmatimonadetes bacterium]|nr:hypothetical protein [Gemmatimonadota bacterium]